MKLPRERVVLFLALLVPLLFFWQRGLNEPDEGRYVEIAREMWTSGDYLTPRIKGIPHFAKPPMTYWLLAASMQLFGVNEFAVRLPGTIAALLILLLVHDLGRRLSPEPGRGALAALALAVSFEFFALSRIITTDMLLVLFTTLAFWALLRADEEPERRRRRNLVFFTALGIGFLTKGPVILGVVASGMLMTSLLRRDLAIFRRRDWLLGLPITIAIGLPWFLLIWQLYPEVHDFFLGSEVVDRVATGRGRRKPFFYFLIVLPLALLPFTPFVIAAGKRLWGQRASAPVATALGFIGGPFLLFSAASSKLWTYILPIIPICFVLLALGTRLRLSRGFGALAALGLGLGLLAGVMADARALALGNNVGYRAVHEPFRTQVFRGIPIPRDRDEELLPPRFPEGEETRIATFRLRFTAAAFYFLRERPEYLPIYGGDSLWEWESPERAESTPGLADLVNELERPGPMLVLLKRRDLPELLAATQLPLRIVETFGPSEDAVVALLND